jgi:hypothetical protein
MGRPAAGVTGRPRGETWAARSTVLDADWGDLVPVVAGSACLGERRKKTGSGLLAFSCTASRHHRTVCTELSSASPLAGVTGRPKRGWGGPINYSGYADLVPIDRVFLLPQPTSPVAGSYLNPHASMFRKHCGG